MKQLLGKHGLRLTRIRPMWYDSFYVSLLSEKYLKRPLGPLRALLVGMISNLLAVFSGKKCSSIVYVAEKD
jgi:hypothetical protein